MQLPTRARASRFALALGLLTPLLVPAAAGAAGFGAPAAVSGGDDAGEFQMVIAPTGRTAVLYEREVRRGRRSRYEFRAAIGPSPDRLGAPFTVKAGRRAASSDAYPTLLARPDGGFVACFPDLSERRATISGCSVAEPNGTFGALKVFDHFRRGDRAPLAAAMRPDGTTVLIGARPLGGPRARETRVATLDPAGTMRILPSLIRRDDETDVGSSTPIVATTDGTVAIPAVIHGNRRQGERRPAVRIMAPGTTAFGPVTAVGTERISYELDLASAGTSLMVRYVTDGAGDESYVQRLVRRAPDGSFSPPLAPPGSQKRAMGSRYAIPFALPSGEVLGITSYTQTREGDSDCFDPGFGQVSLGPLEPAPGESASPTVLSASGQIALGPSAAAMADGTVIATWQDSSTDNASSRVEIAVRAPGATAFAAPQVMRRTIRFGAPLLAVGGDQAAVAWATELDESRSEIVVASLRAQPPYAPQARRPSKPSADCDE